LKGGGDVAGSKAGESKAGSKSPKARASKAVRAAKRALIQANFKKNGLGSKGVDADAAQKAKMKKAVDNAKIKVGDKEAARKTEEDARIKKEQDTQQKVLKARAKHKAVMDKDGADFTRDLQEGTDMGGRC
jgi:hypothetical protein